MIQFLINTIIHTSHTFILTLSKISFLADTLKISVSVTALCTSGVTVVSFGLTLIYVCK